MTVAADSLVDWKGKNVILHKLVEGGGIEELEGKIDEASAAGVAFKPKGKSGLDLILPGEIEEITAAPEKPKALTRKKLPIIKEGGARQHMLTYHGVPLDWAKAQKEEDVYKYHSELDHANLGHFHADPDEKKSDEAVEETVAEGSES